MRDHSHPLLRLLFLAGALGAGALCIEPEPAPSELVEPLGSSSPSPMPDRVVLTFAADPATSIDVTWRTDASVAAGQVEYALAEPGPRFVDRRRSIEATSTDFETDGLSCRYHTAQLAGLEPATQYLYRVGGEGGWSEWFQFRTASDEPEPFSFVYFGDAQNGIRSHWSRVVRGAAFAAPEAAFHLHAGDLVNTAGSDREWGEWFGAASWLNGMRPVVAMPGNHEYTRRGLSPHWRVQFAFPENGPEGLEETAYWFDYQGVRFVSLNTNQDLGKQAEWLPQVLADHGQDWLVVSFHHPVHGAARGRDNPALRALLKPIFDEHGVDLVLQGHDHCYQRSGLQVPASLEEGAASSGNTVYVVSVSGAKMYELEPKSFTRRTAAGVQLYQVIDVAATELRYRAHLATGEIYDEFVLRKTETGANELLEGEPEVEEILDRD